MKKSTKQSSGYDNLIKVSNNYSGTCNRVYYEF